MSADRVGVVIFGLGRAGKIHVKNILNNPRIELKYVIEEAVENAVEFLRQELCCYATVLAVSAVQVALADPSVKAAVICTPTPVHEQCVLMALRAGKAVFCEKPIADTLASTEACYDEAEKQGLPLFCALNRRFDPGFRSIIESAKKGKVGQIHMIKQTSRDSPLPSMEYLKISNGIFHDCAVHDIDVVSTIAGEAPSTIYAQAHSFVPGIKAMGDVDAVAITLKFPCGMMAQIDLDRLAVYGYDQRLEVFGDKGMLRCENMRPTAVQLSSGDGTLQERNLFSFPQRYAESYFNQLNHFIDVVKGQAEMEVKKENVMLACKIASACEHSYKTGTVVNFQN
ncbi:predicted protein [Nematostella vectensis]|uniref:Inositol 2-dehydrogenase n=1 Tax=Nematostella vectensis TaxID=45351 RepID=A7SEM4_NEMVE|nr:uncharacterized oxidoreductase YrbE [Nematostella vectensis]EDO37815.1 predicted protein [Nematostella vectensis]|eukprot:XP_001629878.1 predicted protein [Nematostella vectensis]